MNRVIASLAPKHHGKLAHYRRRLVKEMERTNAGLGKNLTPLRIAPAAGAK
ncbi:MAG: hypothetical protein N2689_01465 [Verrucomicrobiae bacterium]|nr:hypothetical protein [Verrucomicrobiae bacterium]